MELEDKVVIVTGASSGIGLATARQLAGEGARVVLAARNESKLRELASEIETVGGHALVVRADLRLQEEIDRVFDETERAFGSLDALINNAGRGVYDLIEVGKPDDWRMMLDLNLFGLIYATQRAIKLMKPRKSGHIVNISSVGGRISIPGWAVYNATKWGVNGFSDAVRKEVLADNIRVTIIEPGAVDTNWGENMPKEWEKLRGKVKALESADVAAAILYALKQPDHVSVNELLIRPTQQER
jgi:NADP-dependent 3-hydroxy acid dehydrogenase YdfG